MNIKKMYIVLPLSAVLLLVLTFVAIKSGIINANAMTIGSSNAFYYSSAPKIEKFDSKATFFEGFNAGWAEKGHKRHWRIATWRQNGTQMSKDRSKETLQKSP